MMSRKPRPLGSVRSNSTGESHFSRIPPIHASHGDDLSQGIMGAAMNVPPQKAVSKSVEKPTPVAAVKPNHKAKTERSSPRNNTRPNSMARSDSSGKSDEDKKELKEAMAREKQLKQKSVSLQKTIEELKAQLTEKDKNINNLQEQLSSQELKYKELLEKEIKAHNETKGVLKQTNEELVEKTNYIEELKKLHEHKISDLTAEFDKRLADSITEKDKEIAARDEKMSKLKLQMAEALKGNSWERQQQLDELTKELSRLQEESDALRMRLKANKAKPGNCTNCQALTQKLEYANKTIQAREKTVKDLESLCTKFQKQLSQQDELLKQWAQSKGHKVLVFPK